MSHPFLFKAIHFFTYFPPNLRLMPIDSLGKKFSESVVSSAGTIEKPACPKKRICSPPTSTA